VKILRTALAAAFVALIGCALVLLAGESPLEAIQILWRASFASVQALSFTLVYFVPIFLAGLAVLVPLKAGVFNIGAEGQIYAGALSALCWGLVMPDLSAWPILRPVAIIGAIVFSYLGGALWAFIAAWLREYRGAHEVISAIMLNFIAAAGVGWAVLYPLKNPAVQYPESQWLQTALRLPKIAGFVPASLLLAAVVGLAVFVLQRWSWAGFWIRAIGANPVAVKHSAGLNVQKATCWTFTVSGGFAGLVGFHQVYCQDYRLIDGFSAGFGFTGLAAALLASGNVAVLAFSSLFFAFLHKGALDLEIETANITRDFAVVLQGIMVLAAALVSAQRKKGARRGKH
jgi:ABC-type uncharacterized transport system permease subunit